MPRPPGRHAFRRREKLMEAIHAGDQSADLRNVLRAVDHQHPNSRMIDWVCYHGQLMQSGMARSILRALKKYAANENIRIDDDLFAASNALVEFNTRVIDLGPAISAATAGVFNAETDQVTDIAVHAGLNPDVILAMSSGQCVLVPEQVATSVAVSASQVTQLPEPLNVETYPPNETYYKPLGWNGYENGKRAHQCPETGKVRTDVIRFVNEIAA